LVRLALLVVFGLSSTARAVLHAHALYTLGLWAASRLFGRERRTSLDFQAPRIAALVVAHDEACVIESCVRSLCTQDYERFDVFVVADNCSDDTAALAARAGAQVIERASGGPRGKPAAVAHGVREIAERGRYDAIAVFDADNIVDPGFLRAVGERLGAGEAVVQGFVDAKNADASWVAASSAIGFWVIDGVVQRPRERLGLSAALMGTGFAARPELFPEALAVEGALADDLEAGARLALRGIRVAYEPKARTLDEKPTKMEASLAQRQRWMQGRWATAGRWVPELLRRGKLDMAVRLVSPSILFSATALGAVSGGELILRALTGAGGSDAARRALLCAAGYFLFPVPGVARQRSDLQGWAAYLVQPAYLLQSVPLAVRGVIARGGERWVKTKRAVAG
jgi:hypothetical protein